MIYLGTIANGGSDVDNNTNTAAPFAIPHGTTRLFVQPSAATMMAAVAPTNGAFAPAATDMLQLGAANSITEIPIPQKPDGAYQDVTLAIRKTDAGAGTTKVFGC